MNFCYSSHQRHKADDPVLALRLLRKYVGLRRNDTTEDKPIIDSVLGGVAVFDFDNDGFLDIFFANGAKIPSLAKETEAFFNRLYRNNHDGTFTDVTHRAGVAGEGYSMGVAAGDYDNDGWVDLYVTGVNKNILYHNNGDGTFSDVSALTGITKHIGKGMSAALDQSGVAPTNLRLARLLTVT